PLPGRAVVTVQLRTDTPPPAVPDIWYQVRKKVGDIKHTLPEGVHGPFLDDEYGDVYVAVYAFTGADYTPAELKRLAEDARQRLLRVKDVSKVVLVGERPEKVFVEFSHTKLATLGVTPQQVFDSLRRQNAVTPAGSVETPTDRVYVRVDGSVGEFTRSFVEALVIVLAVSFLSLGLRSGVVVALSVPLVLAITLVVMNAAGMNLDRISLGALILALGLLVDDAIIAVEMMVVKME